MISIRFPTPLFATLPLLLVAFCLSATVAGAGEFDKEVEPIFREHCLDCHGPDEQQSQFRLDRLAPLLAGGNSGEPAVVPGDPNASYLVKLIRHEEPGWEMPPEQSLSPEEIAKIEQWIAAGANTPKHYGPAKVRTDLDHWSFQPIKRPDLAGGESNAIDDLVGRKLTEAGLQHSAIADRRVLIRRLYLVMTGLPPTPEQVEAFVADQHPNAWQHLVENVLASPHYGERWASHWLDIVRFGETNGFETNRERPNAWRFRDWVIDSLNQDLPYDQFVRQQIAGDAIGADVATGFLVAGPHDIVKGQDPLLGQVQRMNELDDMINTTGTTFLGLTTGCARCHSHKFDPISQRDYYAMQAIFAGVQHGDRPLPPTDQTERLLNELAGQITERTENLKPFLPKPQLASPTIDPSGVLPALRPAVNAKINEDRFEPRMAKWVRFTIEATSGGEACIDELEIYAGDNNVALASAGAQATSSGDFKHPLHKLQHLNDGRYGNPRSWIVDSVAGGWVQIQLAKPEMIDRVVWGRDREQKYSDRLATKYRIEVADGPDNWELVSSSADRRPTAGQPADEDVYDFNGFSKLQADQGRRWLEQLRSLKAQTAALEQSTLSYSGTFSQPGPTHRLYRGEPDARREQVAPDAIAALTSLDLAADTPEQDRRLALANWIAAPDNPLTPRVIVNRLWQFHFGAGLVDTPNDFGANGSPPTHPELLDWLAAELIENNWSLKQIHRLILNSVTWRQSGQPRVDALRMDANSRLLWRFPPRRGEAEIIRDSILVASGAIQLAQPGGPGFSAFDVDLENVRHYHPKQNYGPADWRRMIYMTKVRQEKDQVFGAFDCPDASMVVPKRSRSTTPLQSLNLFNSRFVIQQAEMFADRLQTERQSDPERVIYAWQLCFGREPTQEERIDAQAFIAQEGLTQLTRALFNSNEFVFIP